jgi:ubiquinone/menaquinone biosynthesis C-methylase UbiE
MNKYVHGYSQRETQRLREQSLIMEELLHGGTHYPAGKVLEAGCGVGAQTRVLAGRSPEAEITSIDVSPASLREAHRLICGQNIEGVQFLQANILSLPFDESSFDHVFVCFVLEHLEKPLQALAEIKRILKKGGSVTVIEGDHGSFLWHPETSESRKVWQSLIVAQTRLGHDPLIGRKLYPLLIEAGLDVQEVSPRSMYTDGHTPQATDNYLNKILIPMLESSKQQALDLNLIDNSTWTEGMRHFHQLVESGKGTGFYSWFKAVAVKQ